MSVDERMYAATLHAFKSGKMDKTELLRRLDALGDSSNDGSDWEKECSTYGQLSDKPPRWLIHNLFPAAAFSAISAPSYNCKTWFALQSGLAMSTGQDLWGFKGPGEKVPCIYHVPEMNEAFVKSYMHQIGFTDSKDFYVRPMEKGLWRLDEPRMLASSKGRFVFLDTVGYFNDAEDASSYQQSLRFATKVYNLLKNGALGVSGLFHPPKYASQPQSGKSKAPPEWSLENSILGSAGYGGMLRSCLRMANLNKDKNDAAPWVYVQGLKNPGLKPFQLLGTPLEMLVKPGESPYLSELLGLNPRKAQAFAMFEQGKPQREITKTVKVSARDVSEWFKEWKASRVKEQEQDAEQGQEQDDFDFGGEKSNEPSDM